jgi:hypothetical protein
MPKKYTRKNKRRRVKKGGDIESGTVEDITPMKMTPPDPERFKKQQELMIQESFKPVSKEEVDSVFAGPTPEEKEIMSNEHMMDEDPLNKDPFEREELTIFSNRGGRRTRKRRRHRKRRCISRRRR